MSNPLNDLINDIIARIEAGVPPWRQAWKASADPKAPLRATGEPFSGSNAWLLAFAGALRGYRSPYWFTFRQALSINAPVAKGEKGSPAILYKTRVVGDSADGADVGPADDGGDPRILRYLKTYSVFNAEQLTDCPQQYLNVVEPDPAARAAARNAVLDAIPARVEFGRGTPCYVPALDLIRLPLPEAFDTPDDFLATKAHEQLHWSGAAPRLDRTFGKRFGDNAYAMEEMVAELGAAFLCGDLGITAEPRADHAEYIGHWLRVLKADSKAIFTAASAANKATEFLTCLADTEHREAA